MQQQVIAVHVLADTTLEVVRSPCPNVWPRFAGSSNDKVPYWRELLVKELDFAAS